MGEPPRGRLLVALAALVALSVPPAAAAAPVTLTVAVAEPDISEGDPGGGAYLVEDLEPGSSLRRRIVVTTTSTQPIEASFYAAGASLARHRFEFADGRAHNELSRWVTVRPRAATVHAGTPTTVTVEIRVPRGALAGERVAMVWAETARANVVSRVGVRSYVTVGGGHARPELELGDLVATRKAAGGVDLGVVVRNTGRRAAELTGTVELASPAGRERLVLPGGFVVAAGRSATVGPLTPAADTDRGVWRADVRVTGNGAVEASGGATFGLPARRGQSVRAPLTKPADRTAAAATGAALAVCVGGAAGWALHRRRRRY